MGAHSWPRMFDNSSRPGKHGARLRTGRRLRAHARTEYFLEAASALEVATRSLGCCLVCQSRLWQLWPLGQFPTVGNVQLKACSFVVSCSLTVQLETFLG